MKKIPLIFILSGTIILTIVGCQSKNSEYKKMVAFGKDYTAAWNSKDPAKVASFYAINGTLTVNQGTPAEGTEALTNLVNSYMEAFPDMELTMDSLVVDGDTYRYHWRFIGTNTGPGGTGNKVDFSGFEQWTMNKEGLVQTSVGTYDANDYQRQLNGNMQ